MRTRLLRIGSLLSSMPAALEAQSLRKRRVRLCVRRICNIYAAPKGLDQNDFKLVQGRLEAARLAHGDHRRRCRSNAPSQGVMRSIESDLTSTAS